ncbi:hypothetical protein DFR35_2275 [Sulfurisoma sediminicola]|uniref:Uncharacterized protein n=1 Tax=Sulfurisoma sediminicola TaxID=1381557 RepID=A0A497XAR0_9PROT|nr:hypothetical protein DFR35_2275 [Sulfurisoma sediminicola]
MTLPTNVGALSALMKQLRYKAVEQEMLSSR